MLEEKYQEGSKSFLDFAAAYSTGRDDKKIEDLILKIYEFSRSYPDSEAWLESCVEAYRIPDVETLEKSSFMQKVMADIRKNLEDARELLAQAEMIALSPDGPAVYEATLDMQVIEELSAIRSYEKMAEAFANVKWARIATNKDQTVLEEKIEQVKKIRELVKGIVKNISGQYFYESPQELVEDLKMCAPAMEELGNLVRLFGEKFEEQKRAQNIIDFSDMEQYALRILTEKSEDGFVPSKIAQEYQNQFHEVMIDEYQDSNLIQEAILNSVSTCRSGRYNIFMVGDVKQSIYRFRLSRPELFLEKFYTYNIEESQTQRIDLHRNFRSRKEVLDGVNFLFYQIMGEALGKVEYDDAAALYPGASFPPYPAGQDGEPDASENQQDGGSDAAEKRQNSAADTELILVETDEEEWKVMESGENVQELEARAAAARIQELVGSYPVLDKTTGQYRPARFGDCVVLLRTLSGWSETFKRVLNAQGIPASVTTKTGYFSASEVMTVLNYLRILDNPLQDIPFTGALHNLPGGFSMEELARVKCVGREMEKAGMYQSLLAAESLCESDNAQDRQTGEKAGRFLELYESIRKKVPYTPMHELLWEIYDRTGLFDYIQAGASGEQQKANLLMLLQKARDYESTSYRGLFNFVRYIENLQKYQVDFGEANILSENEDTVKIMSIHKSKGLEFPVVFVSGMGKQFNQQDARASLAMHPDLGVGADWVDAELRTKTPTLLKKAVQRQIQIENLGEELRILYVALTRAKEKLILTGSTSRLEKRLTALEPLKKQEERRISYGRLAKARCYLDWIFPALARHRCMDEVYLSYEKRPYVLNPLHDDEAGFHIQVISPTKLTLEEAETRMIQKMKKQEILEFDTAAVWDEKVREQIEERFTYSYPYPDRDKIPAKVTVSEVKRLHMEDEESTSWYEEEEEMIPYIPSFIEKREEGLTGAGRGTAYHRVFECLDFSKAGSAEEAEEQLLALESEHRIDSEIRRTVSPRDVYQFAASSIGRRMAEAQTRGSLYREQPFVMEIAADRLKEEYPEEERVLVQGIIDAFFYEGDSIVLVDYKTDRVRRRDGSDLIEKYRVQLDYYAEALERVTGRKVTEKYIYSVELQKGLAVQQAAP